MEQTRLYKKLLKFNEWSKKRIAQGLKNCTARHERYSDDPRVDYITPKLPWWFIQAYLWQPEGATSPNELRQVIEEIYKRPVHNDEQFYVHFGDFTKKVEL